MPSVARAAIALLIAVTLHLGLGAAIAAGTDADEIDSVNVGQPMLGDIADYDLELSGDWGFPTEGIPSPALRLEWTDGGDFRANDTRVHQTDLLTVRGFAVPDPEENETWEPMVSLQHYAAGTSRALGSAYGAAYEGQQVGANTSVLGVPVLEGQSNLAAGLRVIDFQTPAMAHCLAVHKLAGTRVHLGDQVEFVDAYCNIGDLIELPGGVNWTVAGVDRVGGRSALRLEAILDGLIQQEVVLPEGGGPPEFVETQIGFLRVWLADGFAYPVRIEQVYEDGEARLDLTGFNQGTAPRGVDVPGEPVQVATAPRPVWGLDDTGIDRRLPLSKAYQAAATDPRSPLVEFLAANRDAYVSQAWDVSTSDGEAWWMWVTGESETLLLRVGEHSCSPVCSPAAPLLQAVPLYDFTELSRSAELLPKHSDLPTELPTVTGLLQLWSAYADPMFADEPATWGFAIRCDFVVLGQENRCAPLVNYEVGRGHTAFEPLQPNPDPAAPGLRMGLSLSKSTLYQWQGELAFLTEIDAQLDYRATPASLGTAPPTATQQGDGPAGGPLPILTSTFALPVPQQAGVAAVALLVGALYWLWPLVKAGGLSLFTRQVASTLHEHPHRARILDAVTANPGIHHNELVRLTDLGNGTVSHHISTLLRHGRLRRVAHGGYTSYFLAGTTPSPEATTVKSDGARRILEAIRARPGSSNLEVAQATGLDPGTVHYHVDRLAKAGLVQAVRSGRSLRLVPATG